MICLFDQFYIFRYFFWSFPYFKRRLLFWVWYGLKSGFEFPFDLLLLFYKNRMRGGRSFTHTSWKGPAIGEESLCRIRWKWRNASRLETGWWVEKFPFVQFSTMYRVCLHTIDRVLVHWTWYVVGVGGGVVVDLFSLSFTFTFGPLSWKPFQVSWLVTSSPGPGQPPPHISFPLFGFSALFSLPLSRRMRWDRKSSHP